MSVKEAKTLCHFMTDEKSVMDLLLGRRSVRLFSPGEVDEPTVRQLLQAAMAAPSAMTKDPWRFVVVRNPESLTQLAAACPGGKMLPAAALAIVVCGDLDAAFDRQIGYLVQDCSASTENLLLAASGLGLGACWVGVYPAEASMKQVRHLLGLPASFVPLACVAIGRPGEELPARTRYSDAHVRHEKW